MKNKAILVLAALVLVICAASVWFLNQASVPVSAPKPAAPVESGTPAVAPVPVAESRPEAGEPKPKPAAPVAAQPVPELKPWEVKIEQILGSSVSEREMGQMLINLMPTTPPEGQEELAQHISNLVTDQDFGRILPMLKNTALPAEVLGVFFTDLMNRDDSVKLPAMLEIAKLPNHPNREEALTDLGIFLDQDNGSDWAKWDSALKDYLKKQAAENAPEPEKAQ